MRRNPSLPQIIHQSLLYLALVMGLILAGCQSAAPKQAAKASVAAPKAHTPAPPAEPARQSRPSPVESTRQQLERKFLEQAEIAFRGGRLFEPAHDNAYDRFQSVLMLNPNNATARAGVQAILISYAEEIRQSLKTGQTRHASEMLREVELHYPAHPILMDIKKEMAKARERNERAWLANKPEDNQRAEYPLPPGALSRRSQVVTDYLARIAQRLQETDETVMIYARTDAEGRWIYAQLKDAVPGYRVRGDIRIAGSPRLSILPPLQ